MKKSVYVSLLLLMAASSSAMAQSGPTPQEKMACRSDAGTFCAEFIGKPPQMNACLRENKPKLSEPCRKVVEAHGGWGVTTLLRRIQNHPAPDTTTPPSLPNLGHTKKT